MLGTMASIATLANHAARAAMIPHGGLSGLVSAADAASLVASTFAESAGSEGYEVSGVVLTRLRLVPVFFRLNLFGVGGRILFAVVLLEFAVNRLAADAQ